MQEEVRIDSVVQLDGQVGFMRGRHDPQFLAREQVAAQAQVVACSLAIRSLRSQESTRRCCCPLRVPIPWHLMAQRGSVPAAGHIAQPEGVVGAPARLCL